MTKLISKSQTSIILILSLLLSSLFLSGCDNKEKSAKNTLSVKQKIQKYPKDTTIKGKVSNKKGTILSGTIKVTDTKGTLIVSSELLHDYHYSITVPAGTELPIELHFYPKTVNSYDKKMTVAVIYPSIKKYDINELTSAIAKRAKSLGGYTHYNMMRAAEQTVSVPDSNRTSAGFKGDITKQYGGWH
ncbi:MAG: hypothetical protein HFP81_09290 [Methylococcales symbiont of Hymedesmia sp. n. MRB-2018]|nr:MAG: hypothetical protein HFP78_06780 [Methylococcales symbiont of Hymedesmia sp. n. MRB-2018]KAF3982908.1 MAG: hypothetical protein HFP81_09290 [Methylococcales symbiont of Hymedesmia sp. n. MRB-2018]